MKKEPERLEMDLQKNISYAAEYFSGKGYFTADDGSAVYDVFRTGDLYGGFSCKGSCACRCPGIINFLGMDGTVKKPFRKREFSKNGETEKIKEKKSWKRTF